MLKNYLLTSLRLLSREKAYPGIVVIGMAIGMACFILIALFLYNEFSYDKHHELKDQIFRISEEQYRNGVFYEYSANVGAEVGPYLKRDYPVVLEYVRNVGYGSAFFQFEDRIAYESSVLYVDNSVFQVFTHEIVSGDAETALIDPYTIAISRSFAERYFGDEDPIGKVIASETSEYRVSLVFEDIPQTSHCEYDALVSIETLFDRFEPNLTANVTNTYLLMAKGYQAGSFQDIWKEFEQRYMEPLRGRGYSGDQLFLEPLPDLYLHSGVVSSVVKSGNLFVIYAFATIAALILLAACINYMNLAVARSLKRVRVKEASIRKVLGAQKLHVFMQHLGEAFVFSLLAIVIALGIVEVVLTFESISTLFGAELSLRFLSPGFLALAALILALMLCLLSGFYPAYHLAQQQPFPKSHSGGKHKHGGLVQNSLITTQFIISMAVISTALLMYAQIQHVQNRPLGFDTENKILISLWGANAIEQSEVFIREMESSGTIQGHTFVAKGSQPGIFVGGEWPVGIPGTPFEQWREFNRIHVDENFFELMGIDVVQGRNFNSAIASDRTEGALVNETALQQMGWGQPIGQSIGIAFNPATIVGVISDFHVRGLQQQLRSTVVSYLDNDFQELTEEERRSEDRTLVVSVAEDMVGDFLAALDERWLSIDPLHPLEYQFLEDQLSQQYSSESRLLQLLSIFAFISIVISCLGLLGIAAYTTEQRSKEIGIRRVLGATILNVVLMLFKTTAILLVVASIIAAGISFWAGNQWLERFYYRIDMDPMIFVLASVATALIAFATMAWQSYKTVAANPVEALRQE